MPERRITTEQAEAVFDILVENAGAANDEFGLDRVFFVHAATDRSRHEVPIGGALGSSGRFCTAGGPDGLPHVDIVPEEETPGRLGIVWKVNRLLTALFAEVEADG